MTKDEHNNDLAEIALIKPETGKAFAMPRTWTAEVYEVWRNDVWLCMCDAETKRKLELRLQQARESGVKDLDTFVFTRLR